MNLMNYWLFASKTLENIRTGFQNLMWGFWDKEAGGVMRRNWRDFIRKYNQIKPFDVAVIQLIPTNGIHALGIIKEKFYDDQTLVWNNEIMKKRVFFPWRVKFSLMIYSEEHVIQLMTGISSYIDGYGIGEIEEHSFRQVLESFNQNKKGLKINISSSN